MARSTAVTGVLELAPGRRYPPIPRCPRPALPGRPLQIGEGWAGQVSNFEPRLSTPLKSGQPAAQPMSPHLRPAGRGTRIRKSSRSISHSAVCRSFISGLLCPPGLCFTPWAPPRCTLAQNNGLLVDESSSWNFTSSQVPRSRGRYSTGACQPARGGSQSRAPAPRSPCPVH